MPPPSFNPPAIEKSCGTPCFKRTSPAAAGGRGGAVRLARRLRADVRHDRGADPLPSWHDGPNKTRVVEFVRAVTTPGGKDHVPPADRIATFDNDGTLWLEYPLYTQLRFVFDRIRALAPQHPEWQDKEPYQSVIAGDINGAMASGTKGLFEMLLVAQSGTTTEEFAVLSKQWLAASMDPRFKRPYTELSHQPMQELLRYFEANGFRNYIVPGGSVEFMRGFTDAVYGLHRERVTRHTAEVQVRPRRRRTGGEDAARAGIQRRRTRQADRHRRHHRQATDRRLRQQRR